MSCAILEKWLLLLCPWLFWPWFHPKRVSKRASPLMIPWDIQGEIWLETLGGSHFFFDTHPTLIYAWASYEPIINLKSNTRTRWFETMFFHQFCGVTKVEILAKFGHKLNMKINFLNLLGGGGGGYLLEPCIKI